MALDLDDGEFWLPSQFLTDDDILMEKKKINEKGSDLGSGFCFPSEFPYGFESFSSSSPLSSPVESVVSSTETESDEEDYLAGLTQQMVHSTLQEVERSSTNGNPGFGSEKPKTWVMSGSPQSTLCEVGSWSAGSRGSSRGSPNGPSQVSSPPTTPMNGKDDAWELLYAAAGQVVRMKINDEGAKYQNHGTRGLLGPPKKPSPVSAPPPKTPNLGVFPNHGLTPQQQLQATQFHQLKQQQNNDVWGRNAKHGQSGGQQNHQPLRNGVAPGCGFSNGRGGVRPLGLSSSAWPPLQHPQHQHQQQPQQQPGSGMRAVFLAGSGTRRESSGTGVFLPRRVGNSSDSRKKPACSTVLLPARVVQALNLNFEDMGSGAQQRYNGGYSLDHDALMSRNNVILAQQKQRNHHHHHHRPQPVLSPEIRLPQEWTY